MKEMKGKPMNCATYDEMTKAGNLAEIHIVMNKDHEVDLESTGMGTDILDSLIYSMVICAFNMADEKFSEETVVRFILRKVADAINDTADMKVMIGDPVSLKEKPLQD